jgi:chemotaxis protein methyltransferase CheR
VRRPARGTVNETYFYREDHQFACLTSSLLQERLRVKPPGKTMRIWSVPCSTGEEPYSIAIRLLENCAEVDAHDVEILASDIDTNVLEAARAGIFDKRALMRLSAALTDKYFTSVGPDHWQILDELRQSVRFTATNIVDRTETRPYGLLDVIFCRNLLIYFDEASRRVAAENLYESLAPGGYICLGHAESMSRISPLFEVCRFADAIVYRRPMGGAAWLTERRASSLWTTPTSSGFTIARSWRRQVLKSTRRSTASKRSNGCSSAGQTH